MISRIMVVLSWLVCFALVNAGAKMYMQRIPWPVATTGELLRSVLLTPWPYGLVVLYGMCATLYMISLRLMPLSVAGPMFLVLGALVTFMLGVMLFGESPNMVRFVGVALSIVGVCLMCGRTGA